jgi:vitamin B12 transporter
MPQALPPPDPPQQVIIVTGPALPDPAATLAYSIETIARERLANAPSHRLDDILKSVPGLQLFRRSDSTSGHPTSQGVTLRALGGNASSRALLVLDGVPQADPFGGWVNWPAYDPAGLAQVRVIRGGGSVPYGPGALAGVIEMTSLSDPGSNGSLELGSRQSLAARFFGGAELGPGLLTLNAQGSRSDGFVPVTQEQRGPVDRRSPYSQGSLRARWVAPLGDGIELQAGGLAFADERERGLPFTENRMRGADASLRLVGLGDWQWSATGYSQWRNFRSSFASVDDERNEASRVALQDKVPSRAIGGSFELRPAVGEAAQLRLGADARLTTGESRELYALVAGQPTRRRVAGGQTGTAGLFAEASRTIGRFSLSGGARLDRWTIADGSLVETLLDTGIPTRDEHYASRSGWLPTARAGALIDLGGGASLRSAAYLGWRMPTLNELFRPFRAGPDATAANPLLKPERLAGAEAGLRYRTGPAQLSVTLFANRLADGIANVTLGSGPGIFPGVGFVAGEYRQRRNIGAVNVRGIEASAELARGPWEARVGASFTDARIEARGPAALLHRLRPAQTPRLVATGELGWSEAGRAFSLLVRHSGARFEDDLNRLRLPPATTFDAFAAWPLTDRLQLVARAQNLLDETVVAGLGTDGIAERATPRTIWLGLRLGEF